MSARRPAALGAGGLAWEVSHRAVPVRLAVLLAVLVTGCGADDACRPAAHDPSCPDLRFGGRFYDEVREIPPPRALQEVGNATYPACNDAETCGPHLGGFAATDVWLLDGRDPTVAVIGLRQGTHTYVVFRRVDR